MQQKENINIELIPVNPAIEADARASSPEPESASVDVKATIDRLLADTGRDIDKMGKFDIEIVPDRTREDLFNNRPGAHL